MRRWVLVSSLVAFGCQRLTLPQAEPVSELAAPHAAAPSEAPGAVLPSAPSSDRCDEDAAGCVRLGVRLTRTDLPRAAGLFQDACVVGSAAGCGNLAVLVRDGRGVAADDDRARALFQRACDGGDTRSCDNLAVLGR
jgi:TPR repeat protein